LIAFPANWKKRLAYLLLIGYVLFASSLMGVTFERVVIGMAQGSKFLNRMFPPNFEASKLELIASGLIESIQIAIIATFVGVLFSLGILAARNLMPKSVSLLARGFIALCRTFHPVIVAIFFVKAIGFGALAGVMALIVASMGFISKLFAESIEEMSLKQVEAVRATGAGFFNLLIIGIMPQVLARFIGFIAYQLDSNLRNSTMVGLVGGGGIGAALFTAYQRFDFDVVLTILMAIIALIMFCEFISTRLRKIFQ
jgi:phosphonate transport system permease protein